MMLLETTGQKNTFEGKRFDVAASATAFDIMSSKLYTRPHMACIRELISNALDAAREAGGKVTVALDPGDRILKVADTGTGMSWRLIETTYSTLFSSTKDGDDKATGGFGVGALSAFAVSDSFQVSTKVRSEKLGRLYYVSKDEEGIPMVRLVDDRIEMETGTIVEVPDFDADNLSNSDHDKLTLIAYVNRDILSGAGLFEVEVKPAGVLGFATNEKVSGFADRVSANTAVLHKEGGTTLRYFGDHPVGICSDLIRAAQGQFYAESSPTHPSTIQVIQGSNVYSLKGLVGCRERNYGSTFVFEVPVGTFTVPPAREELLDTPQNLAAAHALVHMLTSYAKSAYPSETRVGHLETMRWLMFDERYDISNYDMSYKFCTRSVVRRLPDVVMSAKTTTAYDGDPKLFGVIFTPSHTPYGRIIDHDKPWRKLSRHKLHVRIAQKYNTKEFKDAMLASVRRELSTRFPLHSLDVKELPYDWGQDAKPRANAGERTYGYLHYRRSRPPKKSDPYAEKDGLRDERMAAFIKLMGDPVELHSPDESAYNPPIRTGRWIESNDRFKLRSARVVAANEMYGDVALRGLAVKVAAKLFLSEMMAYLHGYTPALPDMDSVPELSVIADEGLELAVVMVKAVLSSTEGRRKMAERVRSDQLNALFGTGIAKHVESIIDPEIAGENVRRVFKNMKGKV